MSISAAAKLVGVHRSTAQRWETGDKTEIPTGGKQSRVLRHDYSMYDPILPENLCPEAKEALRDFGRFRSRYLGRRSTPWQEEAAHKILELSVADTTEFAVINVPPGSGKSTTFVHDIPLWLVARDRTIRILLGSSTQRLATTYSKRLRNTLSRSRPLPANPTQGREWAAEAALAQDFGRFKPVGVGQEIWRAEEWTVAQLHGESAEDKEPTCQAFGADTEFLGSRANIVIWDDLVTGKVLRNQQLIEDQQKWWVEEGETRVEPGGLLILQGQRMGANDLYRFALDQELEDHEAADAGRRNRYHHIVYPAHFEDRCEEQHTKDAPAYPDGCLLDPVRLPWRGPSGLATIRHNREDKFRVQYQQEDVDPAAVLVPMVWITGGKDEHGEYQGCWDPDRRVGELPTGLAAPVLSIATADPSPTKFWSIQWWLVHPESNQRFLIDLLRQSMDAPDFLDWNQNNGVFSGVMHEWQERSVDLGAPITHWIVENNAAQRFLLQYDHVRRWQRQWSVNILAHATHRNKTDPDFGVQMLKNLYRFGQVRLPGHRETRMAPLKLVDEVTRYPQSTTDDCLMAQWFLEFNLDKLIPRRSQPPRQRRPTWLRRAA